MATSATVGAVLPEVEMTPSPWIQPIWPPRALLHGQVCAFCGMALWLGAPIQATDRGLAHAECGGEA